MTNRLITKSNLLFELRLLNENSAKERLERFTDCSRFERPNDLVRTKFENR